MAPTDALVRLASPTDASAVARLLHDFNLEYATPSPGVEALTTRLGTLLAGPETFAVLAGAPAVGVALVTTRPNVWYEGPVALLDELYVRPDLRSRGIGAGLLAAVAAEARARRVSLIEINVDESDVDARRFYERHGWSALEPDTGERALYYWRELPVPPP
jgi:GNAT superfamily N-acetyltransferase